MPWNVTPARRDEPELMDAPGLPDLEVADAYDTLARVNRQLGNLQTVRRELRRFLDEDRPPGRATWLDVGSGSGDIPIGIRDDRQTRSWPISALTLDRDPTAVALARRRGLAVARGDALALPFADRSVDLVSAIKFAHHFSGPPLARLVGELARVARRRVLIVDIRRHWLAYCGFVAWSRVFTRNRLVRHDGPLSVLRGFTPAELAALGEAVSTFSWSVRGSAGFQLALVGGRIASGPGEGPDV